MKFKFLKKENLENLPQTSGVYCFKDRGGKILYLGKAANLRSRIKNHFLQLGFKDWLFLEKTQKIGYLETFSEIEALILEASLIKKIKPPFNVLWKDDKNYFFVGQTKEKFPRIFLTHQKKLKFQKIKVDLIGPFVDGKALKQTLAFLRKVFPYRSCKNLPKRPCLWYHLLQCPAPCLIFSPAAKEIGLEEKIKKECQDSARNLKLILQGKKTQVLKLLKKKMEALSKKEEFEQCQKIKNQIEALNKVLAHALIFEKEIPFSWKEIEKDFKDLLKIKTKIEKIEAYDISALSGKEASGSMVCFIRGLADKNLYRRFRIKFKKGVDDISMLKEVLSRRFKHQEWEFPDLILIDGGKAQLNCAIKVKNQRAKARKIKVISLAKKKNLLYVEQKKEPLSLNLLSPSLKLTILRFRDEAHRFARAYHLKLRKKAFFNSAL